MHNYPNINETTMMGSRGALIKSFSIAEIIFREVGTYDDQFNRSYRGMMSHNELNAVMSHMDQTGTRQFRPEMLGQLAPNMLSLDAAPDSGRVTNIANGWQTRRFMFLIRAIGTDMAGVMTMYMIQGYTDEMGISLQSQAIDPRMSMYINNVVEMTMGASVPMMGGAVPSVRRFASSDLLQNVSGSHDPMFKMRPTDVYSRLTSAGIAGETSSNLYDTRTSLNSKPEMSRHNNNLTSHFATNVISSYMSSPVETLDGGAPSFINSQTLFENAAQTLQESTVASNPFITALAHKKGMASTGFFRYADLLDLDRSLVSDTSRIIVNVAGNGLRRGTYAAGNAADWGAAKIENRYAATLAQAVPALMMQMMMTHVIFRSTNKHVQSYSNQMTGDYMTLVSEVQGFNRDQVVELAQVETFVKRFNQEVMAPLCGGVDEYELQINAMVTGDTLIEISINGDRVVPFVAPTFVSSLTSPVITPNFDRVNNLASQIGNFVETIKDGLDVENDFSSLVVPWASPSGSNFF